MRIGAGDEVIVPSLTFVATANAVTYTGATPHFADIETTSLGLDAGKLREHLARIGDFEGGTLINTETGKRIGAICWYAHFWPPM